MRSWKSALLAGVGIMVVSMAPALAAPDDDTTLLDATRRAQLVSDIAPGSHAAIVSSESDKSAPVAAAAEESGGLA